MTEQQITQIEIIPFEQNMQRIHSLLLRLNDLQNINVDQLTPRTIWVCQQEGIPLNDLVKKKRAEVMKLMREKDPTGEMISRQTVDIVQEHLEQRRLQKIRIVINSRQEIIDSQNDQNSAFYSLRQSHIAQSPLDINNKQGDQSPQINDSKFFSKYTPPHSQQSKRQQHLMAENLKEKRKLEEERRLKREKDRLRIAMEKQQANEQLMRKFLLKERERYEREKIKKLEKDIINKYQEQQRIQKQIQYKREQEQAQKQEELLQQKRKENILQKEINRQQMLNYRIQIRKKQTETQKLNLEKKLEYVRKQQEEKMKSKRFEYEMKEQTVYQRKLEIQEQNDGEKKFKQHQALEKQNHIFQILQSNQNQHDQQKQRIQQRSVETERIRNYFSEYQQFQTISKQEETRQKEIKIQFNRKKKEKEKYLQSQKLNNKFNETDSKIYSLNQEKKFQIQEKFAKKFIKDYDIEDNLSRQNHINEIKKKNLLDKLSEIEERRQLILSEKEYTQQMSQRVRKETEIKRFNFYQDVHNVPYNKKNVILVNSNGVLSKQYSYKHFKENNNDQSMVLRAQTQQTPGSRKPTLKQETMEHSVETQENDPQ